MDTLAASRERARVPQGPKYLNMYLLLIFSFNHDIHMNISHTNINIKIARE